MQSKSLVDVVTKSSKVKERIAPANISDTAHFVSKDPSFKWRKYKSVAEQLRACDIVGYTGPTYVLPVSIQSPLDIFQSSFPLELFNFLIR